MNRRSVLPVSFGATWLTAVLLAGVNSCAPEQSTLVVLVAGLRPDMKTLHLTARLAGNESIREYVAAPTIGLKLPAGSTGAVELMINGLGGDGCPVATGQSSVAVTVDSTNRPLAYFLGCASAASVLPGNHPLGVMLAAAGS